MESSPTLIAKLEDDRLWLRYVGHVGPKANTCIGEMYWGDCASVAPDKADHILTSGDFVVLTRGRCRGVMAFSGERCVQECAAGSEYCALHDPKKGV